jgi:zinc-finger of transposase IS204/IS1001/IS1096/IS1165
MSTSLLYHAFGLRGYRHVATHFHEGGVIFRIAKDFQDCCCSACGSPFVASRGQVERQFRCLPIGHRPVTVVLPIPRVQCWECGAIRQVALDFAEPRRSYTKAGRSRTPCPARPEVMESMGDADSAFGDSRVRPPHVDVGSVSASRLEIVGQLLAFPCNVGYR